MILSAVISGGLLCLTQPRFNLWWMAYLALIPFLAALKHYKPSWVKATLSGWLMGTLFMGYTLSGLYPLKAFVPHAWVLLVWGLFSAYQGLFYAALFGIYAKWGRGNLVLIPVLWTLLEWLRSFGSIGNTLGNLGVTQVHALPFAQLAAIGGAWLVTFCIVCISSLLISPTPKKVLGASLCISLWWGWGHLQLVDTPHDTHKKSIVIIQGNHSEAIKLSDDQYTQIQKTYTNLSQQAIKRYHPDIILWPETVTPFFNTEDALWMNTLYGLAQKHSVTFMFGTPIQSQFGVFNALVALTPQGVSNTHYYKRKLVPFGEYIPLRSLLSRLGIPQMLETGDYNVGTQNIPIPTPAGRVGGIICVESLYPTYFKPTSVSQPQADWFAVVANNAWFMESIGADLHFDMAIIRAIETNRYIVQSANTGISGIISNTGKVLTRSSLNTQAILVGQIETELPNSLYHHLGDWIIAGCGLSLVVWILRQLIKPI